MHPNWSFPSYKWSFWLGDYLDRVQWQWVMCVSKHVYISTIRVVDLFSWWTSGPIEDVHEKNPKSKPQWCPHRQWEVKNGWNSSPGLHSCHCNWGISLKESTCRIGRRTSYFILITVFSSRSFPCRLKTVGMLLKYIKDEHFQSKWW